VQLELFFGKKYSDTIGETAIQARVRQSLIASSILSLSVSGRINLNNYGRNT